MKKFIALLLSLMLLCAPLSGLAQPNLTTEDVLSQLAHGLISAIQGESSGVRMTFSAPNGTSATAALANTANGPAMQYTLIDQTVLIDPQHTAVISGSDAISTDTAALLLYMLTGLSDVPALTDADLALLQNVGQRLLTGVMTSRCVTYTISDNMLNLHIDVDGLLRQLNTLLPEALSTNRAAAESLLARFTPILFGQALTLDQFTALWQQLELGQLRTGLTLDAMLFESANDVTLIASCMGWTLKSTISETRFTFALTAPDGTEYAFDTNDLLTLSSILSAVPTAITADAFTMTSTVSDNEYRRNAVQTIDIHGDLNLVLRDLMSGVVSTLTKNQLAADLLLDKYQPWIDLFRPKHYNADGELLRSWPITADDIIDYAADARDTFANGGALPYQASIVYDSSTGALAIDADLAGEIFFDANVASRKRLNSFDATLRVPSEDVVLTLTSSDYGWTLASTEDLGGFYALSYSATPVQSAWFLDYTHTITTDTDLFRMTWTHSHRPSSNKWATLTDLSIKAGDLQLTADATSLHVSCGRAYLDYRITNDSVALTSPYFGVTVTGQEDLLQLMGYFSPTLTSSRRSTVTCMVDNHNQLLTATISPYGGSPAHLTYRPGRLSLLSDAHELVIADMHHTSATQNITQVTYDDLPVMTFVTDVAADGDAVVRMYAGADTSGACWTLSIDADAAPLQIPADAVSVDPAAFLLRIHTMLAPSVPAESAAPDASVDASDTPADIILDPAE